MNDGIKKVIVDEVIKPSRRFVLFVIGDEILSGRRQDKHLSKLIELLSERGLNLSWAKYLADDPEQITKSLKESFLSGDVVFSTEYDQAVGDLVNYLQWMAEPAQNTRVRVGVWVVLFLLCFAVIAWRLNAAYWKDIR